MDAAPGDRLGGAFCSLIEPLWDSVYHLWFYVPGQWNASKVFGVHIPIWVLPTYVWFYGGQAYAAYRFAARGATARSVASLAATVWVVATTFELLGTNFGVYEYYGYHPLRVAGFPLWISTLNGVIPVVTGVVLARVVPLLSGGRTVLAALVVPFVNAAVMFGAGTAALTALNLEDPSPGVVWLGCGVTVLCCLGALSFACSAAPRARSAMDGPAPRPVNVPASA